MESLENTVEILQIDECTPEKFYIRMKSMVDEFYQMDKEIQICYNDPEFVAKNDSISASILIVEISRFYHRARFVSIENELVNVFLIDEGKQVTVHVSRCLGIDDRFTKVGINPVLTRKPGG